MHMEKFFFGNHESEIQALCVEFSQAFPESHIREAIANFRWGKNPAHSKREREEVAMKFQSWVFRGCPISEAKNNADLVMQWGFKGQKSPESLAENLEDFCELITVWKKQESAADMQELLARHLRLKDIGIAKVSKWICFVDPKRFCIYDSRVSVTLRALGKGEGRTFPTVGRRKTERTKSFPNQNHRTAEQMAVDYCKFLDLIHAIRTHYQMNSASEIEMALFMLGDDPQNWSK